MKRTLLLLLPLVCAVGCSNRPLASALDCIFPSKINRRPDAPPDNIFGEETRPPRPEGRDPLPPPTIFDPAPAPRTRDGLPRIGDPIGPSGFGTGATGGTGRGTPLSRDPNPDAMPLPDGGRQ